MPTSIFKSSDSSGDSLPLSVSTEAGGKPWPCSAYSGRAFFLGSLLLGVSEMFLISAKIL